MNAEKSTANSLAESKRARKRWRRWILFSVALIVIPGTFAYIEFVLSRPIGEGPAGPHVDVSAFDQVWTQEPVRVIGVGDSVTAGLGARGPSHTFFNRVLKNPADEFPAMKGACLEQVLPNLEHEIFAISGSESNTHLEVIRQSIPAYEAEYGIVLMTSGGNDLIHSYGRSDPRECAMYGATVEQARPWISRFAVRLGTMFSELQQRFPAGCEIYIGDIYDPTDGVGDAPSIFLPDWPDGLAIHALYNEAIRSVAASHSNVHVVPLYETFLGHGSHCRQFWRSSYDADDPHYWFFTNIEDPNDRGYDAIRRVFLNSIVENTKLISR
ncbi:SGNH/GDSL hydrolase family protein [Stieleria sp. JC731]|uniref:SGNH/GDSL hydrolase family protein n=1 Tax=Pirellulaceae TaxID=2691357 RepID=UPI001E5BEFC2|nr:SGNH/GDSL hydrolase family protein [Stieleria sp. JC731]MCC9602418.1 SGNH/GDSL hydrolase family protein [Stieleria sp. JC731]